MRTRGARILLTRLDGVDAQALAGHLRDAGFDATLACSHAELCLKLLTWQPDAVITEGPTRAADGIALTRLIRTSARRPVATILVCKRPPDVDLGAAVVLEPVVFAELELVLRSLLEYQDGANIDRSGEQKRL
jgi:DNA-binding response OmpR family regulator